MRHVHTLQRIAMLAVISVLAACGGGNDDDIVSVADTPIVDTPGGVRLQIVSFGDNLSDVGTYAPFASTLGGGRFTTNPGQVWTQLVATHYGDTLTAAQTGGFSAPVVEHPDGFGYAQGGALTVSVALQMLNYFGVHGRFNAGQLVLIQGGTNDVIQAANNIATDATNTASATAAVQAAGVALARAAQTAMLQGATHVVVVNTPNLAETPLAMLSSDPTATAGVFNGLVQTFNTALSNQLTNDGVMQAVIFVDAATWFHNALATFQADGFTVSNTGTACDLAAMAKNPPQAFQSNPAAYATSLFCSSANFTVAGADQTFMFADLVSPTTHLHALFATYVEHVIAASGLGR